eukprot:gene27332-4629_t
MSELAGARLPQSFVLLIPVYAMLELASARLHQSFVLLIPIFAMLELAGAWLHWSSVMSIPAYVMLELAVNPYASPHGITFIVRRTWDDFAWSAVAWKFLTHVGGMPLVKIY